MNCATLAGIPVISLRPFFFLKLISEARILITKLKCSCKN